MYSEPLGETIFIKLERTKGVYVAFVGNNQFDDSCSYCRERASDIEWFHNQIIYEVESKCCFYRKNSYDVSKFSITLGILEQLRLLFHQLVTHTYRYYLHSLSVSSKCIVEKMNFVCLNDLHSKGLLWL